MSELRGIDSYIERQPSMGEQPCIHECPNGHIMAEHVPSEGIRCDDIDFWFANRNGCEECAQWIWRLGDGLASVAEMVDEWILNLRRGITMAAMAELYFQRKYDREEE
jgi:hypothetical protein